MSKPKAIIVDYGTGNLLSVERVVEACGGEVTTSSDPSVIGRSDRVILPGVGAFSNGMKALRKLGLVEVIRAIAEDGVPLLGICLGMQMLFDESEEYGLNSGLGIIPGRVVPVPGLSDDKFLLKTPYIGWHPLVLSRDVSCGGLVLRNYTPGEALYFVHSFMAVPDDSRMRVADYYYCGNRIPAVIAKENIFGFQFHPEKSGEVGLKFIRNFLRI